MPDDVLASISPRQREVFRLIGQGVLIKNIGAEMGISESTVREYIKIVRARLPQRSNETIARMLSAYENASPQSWEGSPQSLETTAEERPLLASPDDAVPAGQEDEGDGQAAQERNDPAARSRSLRLLFLSSWDRPPNELSVGERRLRIVLLAIFAAGATSALIGLLILMSLFLKHQYQHGG